MLVNARDVKHVPGRKTDVNDAQWLQQLHEHGLLRGSFRPREQVVQLRASLRHRERLIEYAASHIQHMQKALMQIELYEFHQKQVAECDGEVEAALRTINEEREAPEQPLPTARHATGRNEPAFDARGAQATPGMPPARALCETTARWAAARLKGR